MRRARRLLALGALGALGGVALFARGFFLTRLELREGSSCAAAPRLGARSAAARGAGAGAGASGGEACWTPARFRRAVVVVIDALRYDFAQWSGERGAPARPWENKLAAVRDLLLRRPAHSLLVPFIADPPTTTMQRLKGVLTGGLPTFMEIKDDVASEGVDVTEDNLLSLLQRAGRNVTFMGDDTWEALFPKQLTRSFPFPSFNVKDLDTVDAGVVEHLLPELRRKDWGFLVAHFLGVDHCGHRFGPEHDEMRRKLLEMNRAIDDVVAEMDKGGFEDTVLLVFGDHGMTADGNHGGATDSEVGAALFVYSPRPLLLGGAEGGQGGEGDAREAATATARALRDELVLLHPELALDMMRTPADASSSASASASAAEDAERFLLGRRPGVQQVDLAATLALLLGLPIPFGNLGSIVPELFFVAPDEPAREHEPEPQQRPRANSSASLGPLLARYESLNAAAEVNVAQVLRYLDAYSELAGQARAVPRATLQRLRATASDAFVALERARSAGDARALAKAHRAAYAAAKEVLAEARESGRALWTQFDLPRMALGLGLLAAGCLVAAVALSLAAGEQTEAEAETEAKSSAGCKGGEGCRQAAEQDQSLLLQSPAAVAVLLQLLARLSNSFIVAEPGACAFLLATLFAALAAREARAPAAPRARGSGSLAAAAVACMACARLSLELGPFQWYRGQEARAGDVAMPWFWANCLLPLCLVGAGAARTAASAGASAAALAVTAQTALAALHWTAQASGTRLGALQLPVPRLVYAIGAAAAAAAAAPRGERRWGDRVLAALCPLLAPWLLVLGPAAPLVVALALTQASLIVRVSRARAAHWGWVAATWSTLTMATFFSTGHESNFNKLHYASPFVGFDHFEYYRGGVMMGANTLGGFALLGAALPALVASDTDADARRLVTTGAAVLLAQALRVLVMMAFAAVERRHLMVWAIFAPKFVFDGATLLVLGTAALASLAVAGSRSRM